MPSRLTSPLCSIHGQFAGGKAASLDFASLLHQQVITMSPHVSQAREVACVRGTMQRRPVKQTSLHDGSRRKPPTLPSSDGHLNGVYDVVCAT